MTDDQGELPEDLQNIWNEPLPYWNSDLGQKESLLSNPDEDLLHIDPTADCPAKSLGATGEPQHTCEGLRPGM